MTPSLLAPVRGPFRALAASIVPEAATLDEAGWQEAEGIVSGALAMRPEAMVRQLLLFIRLANWLALLSVRTALHSLGACRTQGSPHQARECPLALDQAGLLGAPNPRVHGLLRPGSCAEGAGLQGFGGGLERALGRDGEADGDSPPLSEHRYDVVVIGSGAGGGTVAQRAPLAGTALGVSGHPPEWVAHGLQRPSHHDTCEDAVGGGRGGALRGEPGQPQDRRGSGGPRLGPRQADSRVLDPPEGERHLGARLHLGARPGAHSRSGSGQGHPTERPRPGRPLARPMRPRPRWSR